VATDAVLFYETATAGEYRGVLIAHMGFNVKLELEERFGEDREALIAWIEAADGHYGYESATSGTFIIEEADSDLYPLFGNEELDRVTCDVDWFVTAEGAIELVTITTKKVVQVTVTRIAD
jgi:hypothetical protein